VTESIQEQKLEFTPTAYWAAIVHYPGLPSSSLRSCLYPDSFPPSSRASVRVMSARFKRSTFCSPLSLPGS
jgi:hypothetical protein